MQKNSCVIRTRPQKQKIKKKKQKWSDQTVTDLKRQIISIGQQIRDSPFDNNLKYRYRNSVKNF